VGANDLMMKVGSFDDCVCAVAALALPADRCVVVAVSGGLDSIVLMWAVVARLGAERVVVASFDHGLREGSAGDVEFVRRLAMALGCEVEVGVADVAGEVERGGGSVEGVARTVRYQFLADVAKRCGACAVLTAHHADDQAETVLFNLARGGGMDALAGMAVRKNLPGSHEILLARPFLSLRRQQLVEAASEAGVEFREDPSNSSPDFTRNRIRHEVLPLFHDVMGRDVTDALVRNAEIVAEESAWLASCANAELENVRCADSADALVLEKARMLAPALRRRVVFAWLKGAGVADVSRRDVLAADEVLMSNDKPAKVNLKRDLCARRRAGLLFLDRQ